jgi:hypothetical protein
LRRARGEVDESEFSRPDVQTQKVVAKLENCAKALWNASGETRESGSPMA